MMAYELRVLGISPETRGVGVLEKLLIGKLQVDTLTNEEVSDVLYSWNSRHVAPYKMRKFKEYMDHVAPMISEKDVVDKKEDLEPGKFLREEYNREYVRQIVKYLNTIY